MITFSNGHRFEYMVASGALAFDAKGWFWERILVWLGFIKTELFTIVIKSLTRYERRGNLCWWKPWTWLPFSPWSCTRLIMGGAVNKVGLTNPGIEWWCKYVAPKIDFKKYNIIVSIFGDEQELVEMADMLNQFNIVGIEVNYSCPNADHENQTEDIIRSIKAVKCVTRHPVIAKLSVDQDYLAIARGLQGVAEAISLNSVKWEIVFSDDQKSPLNRLEKRIGGGGGGVSGKPAQKYNWKAVKEIAEQGLILVIAPSIMEFEDLNYVRKLGAKAVSFGTIHLPSYPIWLKPWTIFTNPTKPTRFVRREMKISVK